MSRRVFADIDLKAIQFNLALAKHKTSGAKQMAIIKANSYGHGLVKVAKALQEADAFGVATLDEAIALRQANITQDIILLEGITDSSDLALIKTHQLQCVIHDTTQIDLLEKHLDSSLSVWMKIDTGMHRLGFQPDECQVAYERLKQCTHVNADIYMMTHLACADEENNVSTGIQLALFNKCMTALNALDNIKSIANSAGILAWKDSHVDWVRPGIMLYGGSPFSNVTAKELHLKNVMTLRSEIIAIKRIARGECVGYGHDWCCKDEALIGVVAIGYGDGYPRHAPSGTPVLVNGHKCSTVGRVSMDMITINLSSIDNVKVGDEVILWGDELPADEIASLCGTISYELFCGITERVQKNYI